MELFGMGPTELLLILVVAMIFLGPSKIADLARQLGKAVYSLRKASSEFTTTVNKEMEPFNKVSKEFSTTVNKEMEQFKIDTGKPITSLSPAAQNGPARLKTDLSPASGPLPTSTHTPTQSPDNIDSPGAGI